MKRQYKPMNTAAALMDDDLREAIHRDCAPCSDLVFLEEYLKRAPEFEAALLQRFGADWRKAFAVARSMADVEVLCKGAASSAYAKMCLLALPITSARIGAHFSRADIM